jgi:penicillin V acylase-like amidase (Ntn superfamily)
VCTHMLFHAPINPGQDAQFHVSVRVMELPGFSGFALYKVPKGQAFPLVPHAVKNAARWVNAYGFVGIAPPRPEFDLFPIFCDGLNEEGLSCAALWMPGAEYPAPGNGENVFFGEFVAWVLGNFKRVKDLERTLRSGEVGVYGPAPGEKMYIPLHFIAADSTGAAVVVECMNGVMNVYGEEYELEHRGGLGATAAGVLTNAPSYDWQRTNITYYGNFTAVGAETSRTQTYPPTCMGLVGLPGDPSSPSRFVRAAFMQHTFGQLARNGDGWLPAPQRSGSPVFGKTPYSSPVQTVVNVALQTAQIVMSTPYGSLLSESQQDATKDGSSGQTVQVGDWSYWTVVRDHTNNTYYYTSAFNNLLQRIELPALTFDDDVKMPNFASISIIPPARNDWFQDASESFKKA